MAAQRRGLTDAAASLKIDFFNSAECRRNEAIENPLDERYLEAMELLIRLADTVDQTEPELLAAYAELWEGPVEASALEVLLREVGFSFWPSTAAEFIARFVARLTS